MGTGRFVASVQYNDFKGTSAADGADDVGPSTWLKNNGHMTDDEFLVGIEIWAGENHGQHRDPISVTFLLMTADTYEAAAAQLDSDEPIEVKRVSVDMDIADFLGLFKRFAVSFSRDAMFNGREYTYDE